MSDSSFDFVLQNQESALSDLLKGARSELIIISPWIKKSAAKTVIHAVDGKQVKLSLYTRFNTRDLTREVTDITALISLLNHFSHAKIRFIPNLHAKIYAIDRKAALITSGNLTGGGMKGNVEAGILIRDKEIVSKIVTKTTSLLDSALCLDKEIFFDIVEKHKKEISIEPGAKNDVKEETTGQSFSLGKYIKVNTGGNEIQEISNDINSPIKIVEESPSDEEAEKYFDDEQHKNKLYDKVVKSFPILGNIKLELLQNAFIHATFINVWGHQVENVMNQERLRTLGREILENVFYIYTFNKYGQEFSPELVLKIRSEYGANFLDSSSVFSIFDYKEDLLSVWTFAKKGEDVDSKVILDTKLAYFGVIYLTLGFDRTLQLIDDVQRSQKLPTLVEMLVNFDPKSALMEVAQSFRRITPTYKQLSEEGPDNIKIFTFCAAVGDKKYPPGRGGSKGEATAEAAKQALHTPELKAYVDTWFHKKLVTVSLKKVSNSLTNQSRITELETLARNLKLIKCDLNRLNKALTHSTWCNDHFLPTEHSYKSYVTPGSAIWESIISAYIFVLPHIPITELSLAKKNLYHLTETAYDKLQLSKYLSVGRTVYVDTNNNNIKNEAFLALLYTIYSHRGYNATKDFVTTLLKDSLESITNSDAYKRKSYKTKLQEMLQKEGARMEGVFSVIDIAGPVHKPIYTVEAYFNGHEVGIGKGASFQEAEEQAAKEALDKIIINYNKLF